MYNALYNKGIWLFFLFIQIFTYIHTHTKVLCIKTHEKQPISDVTRNLYIYFNALQHKL